MERPVRTHDPVTRRRAPPLPPRSRCTSGSRRTGCDAALPTPAAGKRSRGHRGATRPPRGAAGRWPGPTRSRRRLRARRRHGPGPRAGTPRADPGRAIPSRGLTARCTGLALWPRPGPLPRGSGPRSSGWIPRRRRSGSGRGPCPGRRWRPRTPRSTTRSRRRRAPMSLPARPPTETGASPRVGQRATLAASHPASAGRARGAFVRASRAGRPARVLWGFRRRRLGRP